MRVPAERVCIHGVDMDVSCTGCDYLKQAQLQMPDAIETTVASPTGRHNVAKPAQKFDNGKPRVDLVDPEFLLGLAQVLTFGANKYGDHNWRNGLDVSRAIAAALRHIMEFQMGRNADAESGLHPLLHAGASLQFAFWTAMNKPDCDDRWGRK